MAISGINPFANIILGGATSGVSQQGASRQVAGAGRQGVDADTKFAAYRQSDISGDLSRPALPHTATVGWNA